MAKKDKGPVVLDLNVKLATGKSKASKPEQLLVDKDDLKLVVDQCIKLSQEIESTKAELLTYETQVVDAARAAKDKETEADNFVKTINVAGTTYKLQIQFKDAYSKLDPSMEEPLKAIFPAHYETMFQKTEINTLVENEVKVRELKELLGKRWSEFFGTETFIKPTGDFQRTYFSLRKTLKPVQVESVNKILEACQSKPAVKYPK